MIENCRQHRPGFLSKGWEFNSWFGKINWSSKGEVARGSLINWSCNIIRLYWFGQFGTIIGTFLLLYLEKFFGVPYFGIKMARSKNHLSVLQSIAKVLVASASGSGRNEKTQESCFILLPKITVSRMKWTHFRTPENSHSILIQFSTWSFWIPDLPLYLERLVYEQLSKNISLYITWLNASNFNIPEQCTAVVLSIRTFIWVSF